MLPEIVSTLACPVCRAPLAEAAGALACGAGHAFDLARQGYANLLSGDAHTGTADTSAMVAARSAFLAAGHFAPVARALADAALLAVAGDVPGPVIDVGAGTGYYLATVLDRFDGRPGLALDLSKHAVRRAARAHPRIGAVVCDAWGVLPVRDAVAACVLNVFAPRNGEEFARVLAPGGVLLTVTPSAGHLAELVDAFGLVTVDARKEERLAASLGARFERTTVTTVERALGLAGDEVAAVVAMGPSARHADASGLAARLAVASRPVRTTLAVSVATWRPR